MNRDKGVCTKPVCVAERTLHDDMKIYLTFNVAPAGAILHIMMKSARTFVHHFGLFLTGKLEVEDIYTFYCQHVSRFAVLIRSAEQWSSQMEELFQDV